jgi:biotin operon repressor
VLPPDPLPPVLSACTLNLLAGGSGVGKTALLAMLCRKLVHGELIFGYQPAPNIPAVAYIGLDRPWEGDTEKWFQKVGLPDIPHYSLLDDESFDLKALAKMTPGSGAEILKQLVQKLNLPPGSVVIVDPIALLIGGDMNSYTKVALGCIHLYRVIKQLGICVIGVDHSSKQKGGDDAKYTRLQDRISGSMAKLGYSATQMYLASPEECGSDYHTFLWNPHHAPSQQFQLRQDPSNGLFLPVEDADPNHQVLQADRNSPLTATLQALFAQFSTQPVSTAQLIALHADCDRSTVWRRVKQLEQRGLIVQIKHGLWTKSGDTPASEE